MLIETTSLPIYIQEQIIAHQQSELLARKAKPLPQKGLIGGEQVFGIWANQNIDGVAYQNQIRSEWERDWEKDDVGISQ